MKTYFKSTIIILICIALYSLVPISAQNTKEFIIQASNTNVSSEALTQSAKVLKNRLITYGLKTDVLVNNDKTQIVVKFPGDVNKSELVQLLTSKGYFGFYETMPLSEITESGKIVNPDLKLDLKTSSPDSRIGCSSSKDPKMAETILNYLKQINLAGNVKLLWSQTNSNSQTCLYVVKTDNGGNPALGKQDIETITSKKDKNTQSFNIEIKFKPESAKRWAALTKKNLNKPIAIVIDDIVFYTPVVKTTMENGLCEITGNLTEKEANYFLALANSGLLTTSLTIK